MRRPPQGSERFCRRTAQKSGASCPRAASALHDNGVSMRLKVPVPVLCALAFAVLLLVPAAAPAKVTTLTGQVVGASFPAGSRVAVPVLLDARSRRRARVRAPLALIKV